MVCVCKGGVNICWDSVVIITNTIGSQAFSSGLPTLAVLARDSHRHESFEASEDQSGEQIHVISRGTFRAILL